MEFIQDISERSDQQGTEREVPFPFLVRQRSRESPSLEVVSAQLPRPQVVEERLGAGWQR